MGNRGNKRRVLAIIASALLLVSCFTSAPAPATAQGGGFSVLCIDYTDSMPSVWQVLAGDVVNTIPNVPKVIQSAFLPPWTVFLYDNAFEPSQLESIEIKYWNPTGGNLLVIADAMIGNDVVSEQSATVYGAGTNTVTLEFYGIGADGIGVKVGSGYAGFIPAFYIVIGNVCFRENLPTYTPTGTITPSNTPLPSTTPTITRTPNPSDTPPPTSTGSPYPTYTALPATISNNFSAASTPRSCGGALNPCSDAEFFDRFPLPVFPDIPIESPAPISTFAGMPTYVADNAYNSVDSMNAFATSVSGSVAGLASSDGITVLDGSGNAISLPVAVNQIGAGIGTGVSYLRALPSLNFGKTGVLVLFILLCLGVMVVIKVSIVVFAIVKRIAQFVLDLLGALKFI